MSGLIENDEVIENIEPITMLPRLGRRAVSYVAERAIDARAGKPFFLYLPLTSPHTPIVPTPEWQVKSGLGVYGDFVMQTDDIVGAVLADAVGDLRHLLAGGGGGSLTAPGPALGLDTGHALGEGGGIPGFRHFGPRGEIPLPR